MLVRKKKMLFLSRFMKVFKYLIDLDSVNDITMLGTVSDTTVSYTPGNSSLELTFHCGKEMKVNGDNKAGSLW